MNMLRVGRWLTVLALLLLAGVYVRALVYTPVEATQGLAQKIFYIHVPAAMWAETAMILVGLGSIIYLFTKDPRLDRFAAASAEVGTVFCAIVLTTGPIWGKPIWGTWWTWDARLTLTLFLFLLYVGYLLLRSAVAVASPTGTTTGNAIQRSPADPKAAPTISATAWSRSASGITMP